MGTVVGPAVGELVPGIVMASVGIVVDIVGVFDVTVVGVAVGVVRLYNKFQKNIYTYLL